MLSGETQPFISICIPAYKNASFVDRLLQSIVIQEFRDFEVIITDDSPDNSVFDLVQQYNAGENIHTPGLDMDKLVENIHTPGSNIHKLGLNIQKPGLNIRYKKNVPAAGTPENWNIGMRMAIGQWIKLMHDDDWFATSKSLDEYVAAIKQDAGYDFFFSSYRNIQPGYVQPNGPEDLKAKGPEHFKETGPEYLRPERPGSFRLRQLAADPLTLLSKNIIGPPSVVIHRNDHRQLYDPNLKWLVDMDFYIRYLQNKKAKFIDKPLINIGIGELQVTRSSKLVREVEIPEHFNVLHKTGLTHLGNMLVYDAWWRLFRNLGIRTVSEIKEAGYDSDIPGVIKNIIQFQRKVPLVLLKIGPVSKLLMMISYFINRASGLLR